jgi:hypothetical protein
VERADTARQFNTTSLRAIPIGGLTARKAMGIAHSDLG